VSWNGSYVGFNAGYGWDASSIHLEDANTNTIGNQILAVVFTSAVATMGPRSQSLDAAGFVGGAQLGYNWQIGRNWLVGIETDVQASGIGGESSTTGTFVNLIPYRLTAKEDLKWFGTMRARVGWVTDRFMVFGTGGLAYGQTNAATNVANLGGGSTLIGGAGGATLLCPSGQVCLAGTGSQTSIGWSAGFGFEWALTQIIILKTDYLHVDLGDQTVRLTPQSPAVGAGAVDAKFGSGFDIVRAGLNLRF
jgi:outer membrane immunogenic protein